MTIAAYMRVSSQSQRDHNSVAGQRHEISVWLDGREAEWYVDEAKSGRRMARAPEYQRLVRSIHAGQTETVVAYSLSRLGRSARQLHEIMDLCVEKRVQIVAIKEQIDLKTPTGRAMAGMIAVMAQLESDWISERTRTGMTAIKASRGWATRGRRIYSDEQRAWAIATARGSSVAAAARAVGASRQQVYRWLAEAGDRRSPSVTGKARDHSVSSGTRSA